MRCYYEELGIGRDANEGDIKTAYRKLALKWHPDKNLDSLEEAKEKFQLIQQAYEVLSDAQERAWYDNHREQILRGKHSEYEDRSLDVFQYFTSSCFKGYGDDEKGFYAVYREVFNKLAAEDAEFMDDEDDLDEIPAFGDSQSDYDDVVGPFYAYWSSYSTKRTYEWLCPYDIREIKERRILRAVEKEMKKIVTNARKERNEEVRNLVAFIRKRDKRVQAHRIYLEEKAEQNRLKQEQNRLEKIKKRQKELEEMSQQVNHLHNDDYEEQLKNLELEYNSEEASDEDEDDYNNEGEDEEEADDGNVNDEQNEQASENYDDYIDDLYCVACNKAFKNAKAFANHESSKKHKDNIEKLKAEMQAEEEEFNASLQTDEESENDSIDLIKSQENFEDLKSDLTTADEVDLDPKPSTSKRKNKKSKKNKQMKHLPNDESEEDQVSFPKSKNPSKEDHISPKETQMSKENSDEEDDWSNTVNKKGSKNKNKNKKSNKKNPIETNPDDLKANDVGKPLKPSANCRVSKLSESDLDEKPNHICVTCKANFPSKNKLFAHLKSMNHGVYIPKAKSTSETSKAKKVNSKRK